MEEVQRLEKILREKGLTDRQVKAGIKYYMRFATKFDIPVCRAAQMIEKMIKGMKEPFEKTS